MTALQNRSGNVSKTVDGRFMNNRRAKYLRRLVTGDPDVEGRTYAREENITTWILHPLSRRRQYREAKRRRND